MPPRGRAGLRSPRSASLWAVATGLVTALVIAGCAGSVSADEANLLAATAVQSAAATDAAEPTPEAKAAAPATADEPLLRSMPDDTSVVGSLAPGFPTDLLPLPADATVLVTSAVPIGDGTVQEISLNLQTAWSTDRVLDLIGTRLLEAGFTEVPAVDTGLSGDATFTRSDGDELISVGVLDGDGLRTVTVGGRVHTAG